jgi:hypothetical protein
MLKALANVTTSVLVLTVTLRGPTAAAGLTLRTAVALVVEFTLKEATVMPAPKLAIVVPCTQ